jgi:cytochrome c oxidase subunit 1
MSVSHSPAAAHHPELSFLRKYIFSEDHKVIGIQFLISSIIFLMLGGFLALMVRIQLGWPEAEIPLLGRWFWPGNAGHKMPP